jgi:hypothetical protein
MKTVRCNRLRFAAFVAALPLLAAVSGLRAQESTVALGIVRGNGTLESSANPVSGVVASARNAVGNYTVTVTSAGAFSGSSPSDYLVHTTIQSTLSGDITTNAQVGSVTADVLTVQVRTGDVETTTNLFSVVETDSPFYFHIRRTNPSSTVVTGDTRHLIATGRVASGGVLQSGFGIDGIVPTSIRIAQGNYLLNLTRAGAFAGDSSSVYVVILSLSSGTAGSDGGIRGGVLSTASEDSLVIKVHTDDLQAIASASGGSFLQAGADTALPSDEQFVFAIYKTDFAGASGLAPTRLAVALAAVDGPTGTLELGQTAFPGGTILSSRSAVGRYAVTINAPGAFAGTSSLQFNPFVSIRSGGGIDEIVKCSTASFSDDQLRFEVFVDDVQTNAEAEGLATDQDFVFTLLDTDPVFVHDLSLSRSIGPATLRGSGIINTSAAGQTLRLPLVSINPRTVFYASENAGLVSDDLLLKSQGIPNAVDARFFRTTGPRTNVTAQVRIGATAAADVRPGDIVNFEGVFRYKTAGNRPEKTVSLRSLGNGTPLRSDVVRTKLAP